MFRRGSKLSWKKIEELLRQFGVTDDEIDELKCQDAINIRKLRVVATSGMCPYSENVRAALISVGELESKSIKLKMTKFIRKSLGGMTNKTEVDTGIDPQSSVIIEGEDYDENDLSDYFDEMTVNCTRRDDEDANLPLQTGGSMSLAFSTAPPKTLRRTFWDDIACVFCGGSDMAQDEPPTYDLEDNSGRVDVHTRPEEEVNSKILRSRTPGASFVTKDAKPKQLGHSELVDKFRLAMSRGEKCERFDFEAGLSPDTLATLKIESSRIGKLYLGVDKLSDGSPLQMDSFLRPWHGYRGLYSLSSWLWSRYSGSHTLFHVH